MDVEEEDTYLYQMNVHIIHGTHITHGIHVIINGSFGLNTKRICPRCRGMGTEEYYDNLNSRLDIRTCTWCNGKGHLE